MTPEQQKLLDSIPTRESPNGRVGITAALQDLRSMLKKYDYPIPDLKFFEKGIRQALFEHKNFK